MRRPGLEPGNDRWFKHRALPISPAAHLGGRARIRTGSYVTVFETAALPFRHTPELVGSGGLEPPMFTARVNRVTAGSRRRWATIPNMAEGARVGLANAFTLTP